MGLLSPEQTEVVQDLIETPYFKGSDTFVTFDQHTREIVKLAKSSSLNDKLLALEQLVNLLGETHGLKEQYELIGGRCQPIFRHLCDTPNTDSIPLFRQLIKLMGVLVFSWGIKITSARYPDGLIYYLEEERKLLDSSEGLFTCICLIASAATKISVSLELQQLVLSILRRTYFYFKSERSGLEELIIKTLVNITKISNAQNKLEACNFLYNLIHGEDTDPEFVTKLQNTQELIPLTKSPFYIPEALTNEIELLRTTSLHDMTIQPGFPTACEIHAGEKLSEVVEIKHPGSILYWGFATQRDDIEFEVEMLHSYTDPNAAVTLENPQTIVERQLCESEFKPIKDAITIQTPGIYRLTWANDYSWFRSKRLRYRHMVLTPKPHVHQPSPLLTLTNTSTTNGAQGQTTLQTTALATKTTLAQSQNDLPGVFMTFKMSEQEVKETHTEGVLDIGVEVQIEGLRVQCCHDGMKYELQIEKLSKVATLQEYNQIFVDFLKRIFGDLEAAKMAYKGLSVGVVYPKNFRNSVADPSNVDGFVKILGVKLTEAEVFSRFESKFTLSCDTEAALLLASAESGNLKKNGNLLVVIIDNGIRSSTLINGMHVLGSEDKTIGDIAHFKIAREDGKGYIELGKLWNDPNALSIGIANSMCFLGSSTVVLSGSWLEESTNYASVVQNVTSLVPKEIWQHSNITASEYGTHISLTAARRLHHLLNPQH